MMTWVEARSPPVSMIDSTIGSAARLGPIESQSIAKPPAAIAGRRDKLFGRNRIPDPPSHATGFFHGCHYTCRVNIGEIGNPCQGAQRIKRPM
jgi:hypothetical protein